MVSRQSKKRRLKLPLALLLGLAVGLAIALHPSTVQPILHNCLRAIAHMGRWSGVAYILLYNLATLCLLPGSLLSFGGGVLFGLGWGLVYVLIASLLGATVAFWIGRYVAQTWVYQKLGRFPQFRALNAAVGCEGCKIVLLTRLSPLFPFNLLNYAFGVTQVSLKDYMIGSLGILPGTIMYVYAGSLAGDRGDGHESPPDQSPHRLIAECIPHRSAPLKDTWPVTVHHFVSEAELGAWRSGRS